MSSFGPHAPPPPANITRTAVQNVTSTSTQHSALQLALHKHLLASLSIRYSHQIITGLFSLPYLFTCFSLLHSSLRKRSRRRQQPCEAEPCASLEPHRVSPGIGRSTRYQVPVVRVCSRPFAFSSLILFSISVLFAIFYSQITPVLLPIRT